ncbi:MAG: tetratricopeptide repeat protein [Alphaproteobacteria bacterium]|nr:tetratricopeptide repeat protein [Alphaproteobacteria bacterium]MDB5721509.1 tetratricopeptide repeat protein [Alphaproteobacteria bacterium]
MMGKFLVSAAALMAASPAIAAIQVLGSSSARMCYEAAEAPGKPTIDELQRCSTALSEEGLAPHDEVATLVNRGILRLRLGRLDGAVADFNSAIGGDPNEPEAYLDKGMVALRMNDGAQAVSLFDTALQKKTRRPALAYYGRAVAQEMAGRLKEAYLDYRQASLLEPQWQEPKIDLARFTVRQ